MTFNLPTRGSKNWDIPLNSTLQDLNDRIEAATSGAQGTTGAQGPAGTQGTAGAQGDSGTQGTSGTEGSQGTQGTSGTEGSQGTQGTSGTEGSQGTQGTSGTEGSQGTQGTSGTEGSQGTQGTSGTEGSQGTQGTDGTQGAVGAQGVQGTQGIQGTQGTVGPAGSVTTYSSTWSGTGLSYTGTPTSSFYIQNGKFTAFYININCATVTNFGNVGAGYSITLPVNPAHNFNTTVGQVTKSDGNVYAIIGKGTSGSNVMTLWTNEKNQKVMDKDSPYGAGGITTSTTFTISGTYIAS